MESSTSNFSPERLAQPSVVRKYAGLFLEFFKMSAMAEFQFRFNIAARIVTDIIWYIAQLSVFEVLFRHTDSINGWSLDEMRVFMGVLFVVDAVYMILFHENLDRIGEKVRKGDLDLLLVKPVSAMWMISFQKVSVAYIGNLLVSVAWLVWSLDRIPQLNLLSVLWIPAGIPIGLVIGYSIRFMTASAALFFTRADAVSYIWYQIYRFGTRPDAVYPAILRYTLMTFLPVAFIASVPASVALGKTSPWLFVVGLTVAGLLLKSAHWLWHRGLRAYNSASS